jgi:hypothetical protein
MKVLFHGNTLPLPQRPLQGASDSQAVTLINRQPKVAESRTIHQPIAHGFQIYFLAYDSLNFSFGARATSTSWTALFEISGGR